MSVFVGDLSEREQLELANLLTKLDQFRNPLFLHDKNTPIAELHKKLVETEQILRANNH